MRSAAHISIPTLRLPSPREQTVVESMETVEAVRGRMKRPLSLRAPAAPENVWRRPCACAALDSAAPSASGAGAAAAAAALPSLLPSLLLALVALLPRRPTRRDGDTGTKSVSSSSMAIFSSFVPVVVVESGAVQKEKTFSPPPSI